LICPARCRSIVDAFAEALTGLDQQKSIRVRNGAAGDFCDVSNVQVEKRPMKKISFISLLLFFLGVTLSLFSAQGYEPSADSAVVLTPAEKEYLQLKRSVTFISQTNYPPFEFIDPYSERRGMMIELAQWISSEIGFHARFTDSSFAEAQAAIQNGSADVLTSFFYSDKRNETFDFTQTVFQVPASIFVLAERPDITDFKGLRGKRIAMQRGDYAREFLERRGIDFIKIPTASFAEAAAAVINGQADAVIGDEQIVLYYLYSNNLQRYLKIVGEPLYTGLNSMAVKEGHELLQSILNKGINHARATGMLERLNRKWIGTPLPEPVDTSINWWAFWPYVAVFAGLLVAVVLYNLHLRRVVAVKTSELKRSERRLKGVIEGTAAGAWEWNLVTDETFYNDRWAQMLGYELAELAPWTHELWRMMIHPEDLPGAEEKIRRHCQGELSSYYCEVRLRHKQGHWVWILDRGKVYEYAADGTPLLMAGTHVDISARKAAEAELHLKSMVLDQITDLVTVTDTAGLITYVNQSTAAVLKKRPDELVGLPVNQVYGSAANINQEIVAECLKAGFWRGEITNQLHEGAEQIVDLRVVVVKDDKDEVVALCGISTDVTENHLSRRALEQSEKKFRYLLDQSMDAIYLHDTDGRILDANITATRQSGYDRDQLLTMSIFDLHTDDSDRELLVAGWKTWSPGDAYTFEREHRRKDGMLIMIEVHTGKILLDDVELIQGIVRDVSDKKELESIRIEHLKNQQVLLDNINTQVWFLTGEHQYGEVNQAHADFFGVAKEDIAFKDLYDFMPPEAVEVCRVSNGLVFRTAESTLTEELVVDGSGNQRLLQIHKSPKLRHDGTVEYVVCSAEDITDRKAVELELEKKNQEMEQFVYIVSHDLKSPLVTIKAFLKMLQEDIRNNDQEQISKDLEFIHSATNKVDALLGALLKLSRVGRMDALATTRPVAELVDECLMILGGTLQDRQVTVAVGEMPFALHGDPLHFGQIWQNLIENAVKYMGDQQQPSVEVGVRPQDKDLVFFVRDNGAGIAPEQHQRVFAIFAQLNPNSEGIGLGLALVNKLVAIYGGRVWVESEGEGKGSCFCFTLPGALRHE